MCSPKMFGFHQPWKPVLGHPPAHLHVPGVDEEHSSQFFAGLVDRVQLGGVEVQALATGTDLEAWHAKLLNLNYNFGPIQFLPKLFLMLTALFISCTARVGACIGRVPRPTNRVGYL